MLCTRDEYHRLVLDVPLIHEDVLADRLDDVLLHDAVQVRR